MDETISFGTAQLAKEKGFNLDCIYAFNHEGFKESAFEANGDLFTTQEHIDNAKENGYDTYLAPHQAVLQKWLRDEKNIFVNADISPQSGLYEWFIHEIIPHDKDVESFAPLLKESEGRGDFISYEEALEEGLKEALKLIK